MPGLHNGDPFPELKLDLVGGGGLVVPRDLAGSFAAVLIYRGAWCPYCKAQLAAFARAQDALSQVGVKVVALSVDGEQTTGELVRRLRLDFPVGYGADPDRVAAATGAFLNESPKYLQSTGFVLDPEGRLRVAVYSSGAIGRLVPEDVVGFVRHLQSEERAAGLVRATTG